MAKPGTRQRATGEKRAGVRAAIVDAAIETLKAEGYAGTSARAIAARGGFSQAAVFYHFGSMRDVLLAALDETSARRSAAYADAITSAPTTAALVDVATRVFREDLGEGHLKVLVELISATSVEPDLGPEVVARFGPWLDLTRDALSQAFGDGPLAALPTDSLAFGVVALYLGLELLTHLTGDDAPAEALFALAGRVTDLIGGGVT